MPHLRLPRDRQRGRLYAWEERVVAPGDRTVVARTAAQGLVKAIWAEWGLCYTPTP